MTTIVIDADKLDAAINANVLIFDSEAPKGTYTENLKKYMIDALADHEAFSELSNYGELVSIIRVDEDVLNYYRTKGGSLAHDDEHLVIGHTSNGFYLLGSY
jgi:uncharacterized protein (DUF4415 family)